MSRLVSPHGSAKLRPLLLEGEALEAERARAATPAGHHRELPGGG